VTGGLAFMISPVADNLTTALLMGAVAMAVGQGHPRFVALACINVVVAANAGGAFSPFGDITTLMVWQAGRLGFFAFFAIFLPSLVNWLVPAALMVPAVERARPQAMAEAHDLEPGALPVVALFLGTITLTVAAHTFLHLPPAVGMMAGLGVLKMYGYLFNEAARRAPKVAPAVVAAVAPAAAGMSRDGGPDPMARRAGIDPEEDARRSAAVDEMDDVFAVPHLRPEPRPGAAPQQLRTAELAEAPLPSEVSDREAGRAAAPARLARARPLDIFKRMEQVEWDTLMFFYGVILCVGGLGTFGYLALASRLLYEGLGATAANVLVGLLSAVIDNVPVMFAVLAMNPAMSQGQWLLVTLTAGVGGSLLSIGSAAGVALMGQARGVYTFGSHLRWAWAIALGYAASIGAHLLLNRHLF
jgi:Na+/H+ antiporter NhaD/arsenite permease-like protein